MTRARRRSSSCCPATAAIAAFRRDRLRQRATRGPEGHQRHRPRRRARAADVDDPGRGRDPARSASSATKLAQRIRLLGLPPVGSEKFHQHALLHIYVDGLLVPLASGIGLDNKRKVFSSLHTHAVPRTPSSPNVIHMESDKPFKATLGDFFAIWGVDVRPRPHRLAEERRRQEAARLRQRADPDQPTPPPT